MLCAFSVSFQKAYKSFFFTSRGFASLIDTPFHSCPLDVPAMIAYDATTKVLDIEKFPQHTIVNLNSDITFIVFFRQQKPFR